MQRNLTRAATSGVYHFVDGKRVDGVHSRLRGYVTGLSGDVSGLSGDVSGLRGDVDSCEITAAEREAGVRVEDLVAAAKETP